MTKIISETKAAHQQKRINMQNQPPQLNMAQPLDFQPIRLQDKNLLNSYLAQIKPTIIEHSFNTLFSWQQPHAYHWAIFENWLLLRTTYQGKTSFLPPVGPDKNYLRPLLALQNHAAASGLPLIFTEVTKHYADLINRLLPQQFHIFSDRNAANYVYNIADLTNLSGKKYHAQKNQLNSFKRNYPGYRFAPLTPSLLPLCRQALNFWCEQSNCTQFPTLVQERTAIEQMFRHWDKLDLYGAAILLDDRVEAFAIGEILSDDTVAILIEKANSNVKGLYSAINQMFLAEYWQDFQFVNRAEDLGLANLRRTKLGYLPHHLEMKYILTPCTGNCHQAEDNTQNE